MPVAQDDNDAKLLAQLIEMGTSSESDASDASISNSDQTDAIVWQLMDDVDFKAYRIK